MITTKKIGELETRIIENVKTTEDLSVLLRIGWGAETTSRMSFKPASELKTGDTLSVTIEKLIEIKEEPKPVEAAPVIVTGEQMTTGEAQASLCAAGETPAAGTEAVAVILPETAAIAEPGAATACLSEPASLVEASVPASCITEPAAGDTVSEGTKEEEAKTETIAEIKTEEPPVDKIGEAKAMVATAISETDAPRLLLRVIYRKKSDEVTFSLSEAVQRHDQIQVTVIRTIKAPEPELQEGVAATQV
jgi:hypothetical protein